MKLGIHTAVCVECGEPAQSEEDERCDFCAPLYDERESMSRLVVSSDADGVGRVIGARGVDPEGY